MNRNIKLNFTPTLEGAILILTCDNYLNVNATDKQILIVTCHSNTTSWNPDPADFIDSCLPLSVTNLHRGIIHSQPQIKSLGLSYV